MDKYVATKMIKHDLGDDQAIYNVSAVITGTLTDNKFISENGEELYSISSSEFSDSESKIGVFNFCLIENIGKVLGNRLPMEEALLDYYDFCNNSIIFSTKKDDKSYFVSVDRDEFDGYFSIFDELKEETDVNTFGGVDSLYLKPSKEVEDEEFSNMISDILEGRYSRSELEDLLSDLECFKKQNDSCIDTIKLQLQAAKTKHTNIPNSPDYKNIQVDDSLTIGHGITLAFSHDETGNTSYIDNKLNNNNNVNNIIDFNKAKSKIKENKKS